MDKLRSLEEQLGTSQNEQLRLKTELMRLRKANKSTVDVGALSGDALSGDEAMQARVAAMQNLQSQKVRSLMKSIDALKREVSSLKATSKTSQKGKQVIALQGQLRDQELVVDVLKGEIAQAGKMNEDMINELIIKKTLGGPKRFRPKSREEMMLEIKSLDSKHKKALGALEAAKRRGGSRAPSEAGSPAGDRRRNTPPAAASSSSSSRFDEGKAGEVREGGRGGGGGRSSMADVGRVRELMESLEELKVEAAAREMNLRAHMAEIEQLHSDNRTLRQDGEKLARLKAKYKQRESKFDEICDEVLQAKNSLDREVAERQRVENERDVLEEQLGIANEMGGKHQMVALQHRRAAAEQELKYNSELEGVQKAAADRRQALQGGHEEATKEQRRLEDKLAVVGEQLAEARDQLTLSSNEASRALQQQVERQQGDQAEMQRRMDQYVDQLQEAQQREQDARAENEQLSVRVAAAEARSGELDRRVEDYGESLSRHRNESEASKTSINAAQQAAQQEGERLKAQVAMLVAKCDDNAARATKSDEELVAARGAAAAAQAEVRAAQDRIDELEDDAKFGGGGGGGGDESMPGEGGGGDESMPGDVDDAPRGGSPKREGKVGSPSRGSGGGAGAGAEELRAAQQHEEELRADLRDANEDLEAMRSTCTELQKQVSALKLSRKQAVEDAASKDASAEHHLDTAAGAQQELEALREQMGQTESLNRMLKKQRRKDRSRLDAARTGYGVYLQELRRLTSSVSSGKGGELEAESAASLAQSMIQREKDVKSEMDKMQTDIHDMEEYELVRTGSKRAVCSVQGGAGRGGAGWGRREARDVEWWGQTRRGGMGVGKGWARVRTGRRSRDLVKALWTAYIVGLC